MPVGRLTYRFLLICAVAIGLAHSSPGQTRISPAAGVTSISDAVSRAERGETVTLAPGIYRESDIVIDKPLFLDGEPGAVIDGGGEQIVTITSDSVEIRGITFRNVATSFVDDRAAIKVEQSQYCIIADNRLDNTFFGIYLGETAHCAVSGNVIIGKKDRESQSGNGIHLWYSRNIKIENNEITGHRDGIYLEFVEDSRINGNRSFNNHRYGLHFMFSDRCSYEGNTLSENDAGVAVMYTKNVVMRNNLFEHNWGSASYGLLLKDITDSQIQDNRFVRNTTGIYVEGSNRMDVRGNLFESNGWAVKIFANAEDNQFESNSFVGNTFDVATNSRMSESTFSGNFWDQYTGYDLDSDGVGDVPFRPVRLFSLIVEQNPSALVLLRSFFVDLLDAAERAFPAFTPERLTDERPLMENPI